MKGIKVIFFVLLTAVSACNPVSFSPENFIEHSGDDIMLVKNGVTLLTYKPASWQLSCSRNDGDGKYEYRVHNDDMGKYYVLTCAESLNRVGQKVQATLEWTTERANESVSGEFTVNKMEDDKIWITCARRHIGLVVKDVKQ